jgi:hypothetical protein
MDNPQSKPDRAPPPPRPSEAEGDLRTVEEALHNQAQREPSSEPPSEKGSKPEEPNAEVA